MQTNQIAQEIASINGVALNAADEVLSANDLRQRACSELLRQAAVAEELLAAGDQAPFKVDNPKPAEWTPPAKKTQ